MKRRSLFSVRTEHVSNYLLNQLFVTLLLADSQPAAAVNPLLLLKQEVRGDDLRRRRPSPSLVTLLECFSVSRSDGGVALVRCPRCHEVDGRRRRIPLASILVRTSPTKSTRHASRILDLCYLDFFLLWANAIPSVRPLLSLLFGRFSTRER